MKTFSIKYIATDGCPNHCYLTAECAGVAIAYVQEVKHGEPYEIEEIDGTGLNG